MRQKNRPAGSQQKLEFRVRIRKGGGPGTTCFIDLPSDSAKRLDSRARVPVVGTVNGFPVRTSAMATGRGNHEMMFNKEMRKGAGAEPGDWVEVVLSVDRITRAVKVPADLGRALSASSQARTLWAKMSYSRRKEFVDWILMAKRPQTRETRVARTVAMIAAGRSPR